MELHGMSAVLRYRIDSNRNRRSHLYRQVRDTVIRFTGALPSRRILVLDFAQFLLGGMAKGRGWRDQQPHHPSSFVCGTFRYEFLNPEKEWNSQDNGLRGWGPTPSPLILIRSYKTRPQ
ncbi:hypothetical protein CEXT_646231 [Caerostris extrusa]|uniref:Uncharacterized protein n=1 Tax=Caerostris extrusa TaxID=172846 RepID=A0AAV4MYG3_CAEEX|nr:hypothetical protein CEXT_646231 [Caerostris extrusa]